MPRWKSGDVVSPIIDSENNLRDIKPNPIKDNENISPITRIAKALHKSTLSSGETPKRRNRRQRGIANDVIDELSQKLGKS